MTDPTKPKSKRGFASMDPDRRREVARKGGSSVQPENRSFYKNRALAAKAGHIGGSQPKHPKA